MKKIITAAGLCALMASSSVFAAPTSGNITVNFTGEVVDTPCIITVGNANSVDLGQVKKAADKKGVMTPVPFRFSQCTKGSADGVDISWNASTNGDLEAATGRLPTALENVYMAFYKDFTGATVLDKNAIRLDMDLSGLSDTQESSEVFMFVPMFAQLQTGSAAPTQTGTVTAAVTFKADYK